MPPRRSKPRVAEQEIINELACAGVADAIRDSLKWLFSSSSSLPDNPFHHLAASLGAFVDQSPIWGAADADVIAALDSDGTLELADAATKLCRLASTATTSSSTVLGLPHVLRCVSREGVKVVADVLPNSLPDSFFPGATPFRSRQAAAYTLQVLASVQGGTVTWHPQWLEFPELIVRCDVVVRGPRQDEALGLLAALLVSDLQDLQAVPVHFVQGVRFTEPLAAGPSSGGLTAAAGAGGLWTLADMLSRPDEFSQVFAREVLSGKQAVLAGVVMLEAPVDTAHLQDYAARFESCVKTYCFHFCQTPDPAAPPPAAALPALSLGKGKPASLASEVVHYGSQPLEALFEGYFLSPAAAKAYLALWGAASSPHKAPYSRGIMEAQAAQLSNLIERDMVEGATLEGFRRLLLLVLLQAPPPLAPASLLSLEELLLSRAPETQQEMLLTTCVNLTRIINSSAADIQAVVREMSALMLVVQQWPRRREACMAQASATAGGGGGPRGSVEQDAATRDEAHATQLLTWLADHNNMEARVVQQLVNLKPRISAATGSSVFSGISTILGQLLAQLPDAVPPSAAECRALLQAAQAPMDALQQLLAAAALSLADALLDRCRDVMWALQWFGIRLVDSVMARAALVRGDADLPPEWVLNVEAVTDTQVRAGAVAERVATEGVMLQYAVDTKLDTCLSAMFRDITSPPLPRNPYPCLLHTLRAFAARLDLFQEDEAEVAGRLLNQLVLLAPPSFIYAASQPAARRRELQTGAAALAAWGSSSGAQAGAAADEDEEAATVFGSYAAVSCCDCRALHALAGSLGLLLTQRSWQQGSYCADVVPALTGDAFLSGALCLSVTDELLTPATGRRQPGAGSSSSARRPRQHARAAPQEPAHRPPGGRGQWGALPAAGTACLAAAAHPAAYADCCLAVIHLLAVVKEGTYVKALKRCHFAFRAHSLAHDTTSTAAAATHRRHGAGPDSALPARDSLTDDAAATSSSSSEHRQLHAADAEASEPHWDLGVYQRVFLSEAAALAWCEWNGDRRGDPAQPFHTQHVVQQVQRQVQNLEASGGCLLDAQKLLLAAAAAVQDTDALCTISRAMRSAVQDLRCLQDMNAALRNGYLVDEAGIHHLVLPAVVETPPGRDAYGILHVHTDRLELRGVDTCMAAVCKLTPTAVERQRAAAAAAAAAGQQQPGGDSSSSGGAPVSDALVDVADGGDMDAVAAKAHVNAAAAALASVSLSGQA